jgi:hypothetical protein
MPEPSFQSFSRDEWEFFHTDGPGVGKSTASGDKAGDRGKGIIFIIGFVFYAVCVKKPWIRDRMPCFIRG